MTMWREERRVFDKILSLNDKCKVVVSNRVICNADVNPSRTDIAIVAHRKVFGPEKTCIPNVEWDVPLECISEVWNIVVPHGRIGEGEDIARK